MAALPTLPASSVKVTVNPVVMDRLRKEDEAELIELEQKYGGHLSFVSDPGTHMEDFKINNAQTGEELYASGEK